LEGKKGEKIGIFPISFVEVCYEIGRVSEGLLFNAKLAISQIYHSKNKLHSMRW